MSGDQLQVSVTRCELFRSADPSSERTSELLHGERVDVLDHLGRYRLVRNCRDGYTGYVARDCLVEASLACTHWVAQRQLNRYREPDCKSPQTGRLTFGAEVQLRQTSDPKCAGFVETDRGDYVFSAHCRPLDTHLSDSPLTIAQQHFTASPYHWGGRSPDGIDCSALVQLVAWARGVCLPRDSSEQEQHIPNRIDAVDARAGDLVFWPGHVAWLINPGEVFHATIHSMDTRRESLAAVIDRAGDPSSYRRLR